MKKLILYIPLIFALSSCHSYKNINIFEDGSAKINFDKHIIKTDSITGITYDYFERDSVVINDLDSIEYYLNYPNLSCYKLGYDSNIFRLKINDSFPHNRKAFELNIPNTLKWEFPNKISNISGQGKILLDTSRNSLVIKKKKSNYLKPDKKVNITVSFENDLMGSRIKHPIGFKRFGYAIDPWPGVGLININGEAKKYLNGTFLMNWGFSTFILNKVRLVPRLVIMSGKTNGKLSSFESYTNFENTNLEFGAGYELLNSPYINITPIIYGGGGKIDFYTEDDSTPIITINGGFRYSMGTTIDLKIDPLFRNKEKRELKKNEYFYIKVDGGWYPNYFKKSIDLKGSTYYLTFAIGGYFCVDNNLRKVILKK